LLRKEIEKIINTQTLTHVFIDEIQRIPLLLNEVQYLMDTYPLCFILTGSSARKLKRGHANLLGGRALQRFLYPFSWAEITANDPDLIDMLSFGLLPSLYFSLQKEKRELLQAYVEVYIREEIQAEGLVRNIGSFSRFLDIAASQFGEMVSYSNLARECQLPVMSVKSYYEICEDTLIGIRLMPWRKSLRKRLTAHPKFYFFDNGVTNAINRYLMKISDPMLLGRLFEQFLIFETHKILKYKSSDARLYYWRTNIGAEVDLLIEKHGKIIGAFEIKWTSSIDTAHLSGLHAFLSENPDVPCHIICNVDQPYTLKSVEIINWQAYLNYVETLL